MLKFEKTAIWALQRLDPERAHELAIRSFSLGLTGSAPLDDSRLSTTLWGKDFANPIGLAAGFDKNARALQGLAKIGFGFVEAGTVTPRPQPGNPKPRLFRLSEDRAIINRMGFNSCGIDIFCQNLAQLYKANRAGHAEGASAPLGINLGINKVGAHPLKDYPYLVERVHSYADYITINLSSPNTPGLRDLQGPETLSQILEAIKKNAPYHPPLLVKLAPDLDDESYRPIFQAALNGGANGLILTNTTLARPDSLRNARAFETGGLSGRPLSQRARDVLKIVSELNKGGQLTLISSGGIESGRDVFERLAMGAHLVQIYTSFIYEGSSLLIRLKKELLRAMDDAAVNSLKDLSHLS
ncbi:quinone-dependent dihydroorotate dehydrogenase [Aristophania vespae]|uniref:quinone-dependent dihydroorotate dehydrogenase n=1 Tax=Aristophania vespae TaxID=2697033 RepID=UPI002351703D|nr:quinone-dependent dihydroorotate dehydrogenase [Aristophania vespae]UMM64282.1 Dihydroorotate dehydrogenase (quinone) [Aristophania vespae]